MDRRRRSGPDGPKRSILVLSPTFFPAVWLSGSQTRRCYSQEMTNSGNSHTTGLRPCESRSAAEKDRRNTERKITHRNNTQGTHNDAFTRHEEFVGCHNHPDGSDCKFSRSMDSGAMAKFTPDTSTQNPAIRYGSWRSRETCLVRGI